LKVTYQAKTYAPEKVTGRYVRREKGQFRVFECATNEQKGGQFFGMAGMGYTLREYLTGGDEIPEAVRLRAIDSRTTEKWD